MQHTKLRVGIFQEGVWLCAHCLEYDFATQAKTLDDLRYDLERMIVGHIAISLENGLNYRVDEFFEIHGSRGIIWVTRCSGEMLDLPPVMVIRGTETVSYQVPMDWRLGFDGAAADFVDGVLDGRQPAQDIQTAKRMLQVPLAIYEAARTGRAVAPESIT